MRVRVVLVEPEHDINVGYCCRAMKNFGFSELAIVNAKCALGFEARMYAKHGTDVLKKARKAKSIAEAVKGCALVVGTTGIARRSSCIIRNPMYLQEFARRVAGRRGRLALVFGREGTGLAPDEIKQLDFLVMIPASGSYPVLNLSHALAVMLYEMRKTAAKTKATADGLASRLERKALLEAFAKMARGARVRQPEKIAMAFKNAVERALISSLEARAMLAALKELAK